VKHEFGSKRWHPQVAMRIIQIDFPSRRLGKVMDAPNNEVILRLRSAIREKFDQVNYETETK
jgi:hypothetical protein